MSGQPAWLRALALCCALVAGLLTGGLHLRACACPAPLESARSCCAARQAPPCCAPSAPGEEHGCRQACACDRYDLQLPPAAELEPPLWTPPAPTQVWGVSAAVLPCPGASLPGPEAPPRPPPLRRHLQVSVLLL